MARQDGFLDKLVNRMERLDTSSLQAQFLNLARERGLLETVFQSIQEGVLVVDADAGLLYANHAAENLLGFAGSRVQGRSVARYFPEEIDWERLARQDEDAWSRLVRSEIEVSHPVRRILSFYAVPLPVGERNDEPGVLVMLRDVTGEREQETSLVESERLNAIRFLASSVAHEIGNPLNALGIHLQLMERQIRSLPDDQRETFAELVGIARNEMNRLDLIIKQFLSALRPSAPELERANLADVLRETLEVMRPELLDRRIEVVLDAPKDPLPDVFVDRNQMKQVFFNLLRNALQAMPHGGRLAIGLSADERTLALAIRDTGTGIPEEDFRRLFEPYRTTKANGHGLGLMIVQRIVQDHGGQIEVSSKPGAGTMFRILLPLADRRVRLLSVPPDLRDAASARRRSPRRTPPQTIEEA